MNISRRSFLRGAVSTAAIVAASGMLPFSAVAEETPAAVEETSKNPSWLGEMPVIADSDISEVWKTDLLIIGAGNGGMMAAHLAADNGIDFRIIEQNGSVGATRNYYAAVNTEYTKAAGVEVDVARLRTEMSRYSSGKMDQRVYNVFLRESAAMHDYLASIFEPMGAVCQFTTDAEPVVDHYTQYYCAPQQHRYKMADGSKLVRNELFRERIEEKGYYIDFNHSLVCLTKEGDTVTGAIAQNTLTGAYVKIEAAYATLLATGGYEGNPEMIEALSPMIAKVTTARYFQAFNKGMGIKAGLWAGAARDLEPAPMMFDRGIVAPGVDAGYVVDEKGNKVFPGTVDSFNPGSQPFLKMDRNGLRFANESCPYNDIVHAASRLPGCVYCMVFDSNIVSDVQRFFTIGCSANTRAQGEKLWSATIDPQVESGLMKKADTLEELAEMLGFEGEAKENFLATTARYNELYDMQEDPDFGKPAYRLSELRNPPYYGCWLGGNLLCTGDALWINEDMQVLTPDHKVIGNLYATGNCAGTTFANNYPELLPGSALGRNLTFAKHVVDKLVRDGIPTGKGPSMAAPVSDDGLTADGCKDGSYSAIGKGFGGDINVTVTISGGKITSIEADFSSETPTVGGAAGPQLVETILAANGTAGVDGVSGATFTSSALINAVNACLQAAK